MTPDTGADADAAREGTLYEALGVAPEATAGEIKRAYFLTVKRNRPEDDPEAFSRVTKAYQVLSDAAGRREYDLMLRHGPQITHLTDRAASLMDDDPAQAVRLCKEAVVLAPEMAMPRRLLVTAFLHAGEFAAAEAETRRLLADAPGDAALRLGLSRCLWLQDRNAEAEAEARAVLAETPDDRDVYLLLSRIYRDMDAPARSVAILEEGIGRGGREPRRETKNDREALLELLKTHVVQADAPEAARTTGRLYALAAGGDTDWVSAQIYDLSVDFFRAHAWRGAWDVLRCVRRAGVADPALGERLDKAGRVMGAHADGARMNEDTRLSPSLRAFAHFHYLDPDDTVSEERQGQIVAGLFDEAARDPRAFRAMLTWAAQTYPFFAQQQAEVLRDLGAFLDGQTQGGQDQKRGGPAPGIPPLASFTPPAPAPARRPVSGLGCLVAGLCAAVLAPSLPALVTGLVSGLSGAVLFLFCAVLIAVAAAFLVRKFQG